MGHSDRDRTLAKVADRPTPTDCHHHETRSPILRYWFCVRTFRGNGHSGFDVDIQGASLSSILPSTPPTSTKDHNAADWSCSQSNDVKKSRKCSGDHAGKSRQLLPRLFADGKQPNLGDTEDWRDLDTFFGLVP